MTKALWRCAAVVAWAVMAVPSAAVEQTVELSIVNSLDDADEGAAGVRVSGPNILMGVIGDAFRFAGLRFQGVDIPRGAEIVSAVLTVKSAFNQANRDDMALNVAGEDVDNSNTFFADGIASRTRTSQVTRWDSFPGTIDQGDFVSSPDLSTIVESITGRPGWEQGNSLALIITPVRLSLAIDSRETTSDNAKLTVVFEDGVDEEATLGAAAMVGLIGGALVGAALVVYVIVELRANKSHRARKALEQQISAGKIVEGAAFSSSDRAVTPAMRTNTRNNTAPKQATNKSAPGSHSSVSSFASLGSFKSFATSSSAEANMNMMVVPAPGTPIPKKKHKPRVNVQVEGAVIPKPLGGSPTNQAAAQTPGFHNGATAGNSAQNQGHGGHGYVKPGTRFAKSMKGGGKFFKGFLPVGSGLSPRNSIRELFFGRVSTPTRDVPV